MLEAVLVMRKCSLNIFLFPVQLFFFLIFNLFYFYFIIIIYSVHNELSLILELGVCYELKAQDNESPLYLFPNLSNEASMHSTIYIILFIMFTNATLLC